MELSTPLGRIGLVEYATLFWLQLASAVQQTLDQAHAWGNGRIKPYGVPL
jgi:hypothetical protein